MSSELGIEFEFRNRRFRDAQKGLEALARELGTSVERAGPALVDELGRFLGEVRRALSRRHNQPWRPGGSPPDRLFRRTGSGISGIRVAIRRSQDINRVAGELIIPFPLSVHEEGARIVARRAQFLTIPLPAALDSRGVPLRRSARDWDNTFVQRSRRGNLLIFQRRGASIVPLFVLKREVELPPRLGARETLEAGTDFFVDSAVDRMVRAIAEGL